MTETMKVLLPESIKRQLRRRQMVTFLFVVVFCVLTAYWQDHQTDGLRRAQRAAYGNCLAVQSVVDQGIKNVHASTALNPEQKAQALSTYTTLRNNLDCQDLRP